MANDTSPLSTLWHATLLCFALLWPTKPPNQPTNQPTKPNQMYQSPNPEMPLSCPGLKCSCFILISICVGSLFLPLISDIISHPHTCAIFLFFNGCSASLDHLPVEQPHKGDPSSEPSPIARASTPTLKTAPQTVSNGLEQDSGSMSGKHLQFQSMCHHTHTHTFWDPSVAVVLNISENTNVTKERQQNRGNSVCHFLCSY